MLAKLVRILLATIIWISTVSSLDIIETENQPGSIFRLDDTPYFIGSAPVISLPTPYRAEPLLGFAPITSIHTNDSQITQDFLLSRLTLYSELDDVWNWDFLEGLLITYNGPGHAYLDDSAVRWIASKHIPQLYLTGYNIDVSEFLENITVVRLDDGPKQGPYLISGSSTTISIYDVYRLYEDIYEAFVFGAIPDPVNDGWTQTNITFDTGNQYIPVPSRLTSLDSPDPLSGKRLALKDIYDARGLQTSVGSIAYAKIYPPSTTTAPSIQKLIALGTSLVGKVKTSQFALGAHPWEFIDFSYPWNPRGDGNLTAASSSSGSACAIAGYEWLDLAVGSDTRASVRKPAALVGAYGIRPTFGSMDLTGVMPLAEELDTVGFFARDPELFCQVARLWYADSPVPVNTPFTRFPTNILYPIDHFPVANPAAQAIYDTFVDSLTTFFNFTKVPIDLTSTLLPHLPNSNFKEFQISSNKLIEYHSWSTVGKPLVDLYSQKFGSQPVFDPIPSRAFERGMAQTADEYEKAVLLKRRFGEFFAQKILKPDLESCSDSILIYDTGTGGIPSYRIEELNKLPGATPLILTVPSEMTRVADGFHYLAPTVGLPDITVPLGQVEYQSHVSGSIEMMPVSVQLVAHHGCEGMLLELIKVLVDRGVIMETKAGKLAF